MRQRLMLLSVIAVTLLLAGLSFAQDTITGRPITSLNVRSGPGTDYDILTVINTRHRVAVLGRNDFPSFAACPRQGFPANQWLLVDVAGIQGWVVRCGLTLTGSVADVPVVGDVTSETITSASEEAGLGRYPAYIGIRAPAYGYSEYPIGRSRAVINVRAEPSLDAEIILVIATSSQFFVVEESEDGAWLRIEWSSNTRRRGAEIRTGWVARHLVTITRWV